MIRMAISVEGQTEEEFVKLILADHLRTRQIETQPILLDGNVSVDKLVSEMSKLLYSFDVVTSLVDFYGFRRKGLASVEELERGIDQKVRERVRRHRRPFPVFSYVQRHEFEGLLFSDVSIFRMIGATDISLQELHAVRSQFATPEEINDHSDTAPSKRIKKLVPRYNKVVYGPLLAEEMGLDIIRAECPRFHQWVTRLEGLAMP